MYVRNPQSRRGGSNQFDTSKKQHDRIRGDYVCEREPEELDRAVTYGIDAENRRNQGGLPLLEHAHHLDPRDNQARKNPDQNEFNRRKCCKKR